MLLHSTSGQGRTPVSQRLAKTHSLGSRLPIDLIFKTSFKKYLRQTLASLQIRGSASRALPSALDRAFQGALSKPLPKAFCVSPTAAAPGLRVPRVGAVGRRARPTQGHPDPQRHGGKGWQGQTEGQPARRRKINPPCRDYTAAPLLPAAPQPHHSCSAHPGAAELPEGLQDTPGEGCSLSR